MARKPIDARCSFCGKKRDQVRRLVAGPNVFICDDCVALCNEVIQKSPPTPPAGDQTSGSWLAESAVRRWWPGWFKRLFRAQELQPAQR